MSDEGCAQCGGLGLIPTEKGRTQCPCTVRKKTKIYLRGLAPITPAPEFTRVLDEATHQDNLLLLAPGELADIGKVKWIFAYLLLRGGIHRTYECLNAYEIVQISFGEHDRYSIAGHLSQDVLCLFYGYHEAKNSMLGDLMLQAMDYRMGRGKRNWILMRGRPEFASDVEDYARSRNFEIIDLGNPQVAPTARVKPAAEGKSRVNPERAIEHGEDVVTAADGTRKKVW